jgi:hypothetical protein
VAVTDKNEATHHALCDILHVRPTRYLYDKEVVIFRPPSPRSLNIGMKGISYLV